MVIESAHERAMAFMADLDHQGTRGRPPEDDAPTSGGNERPSAEERQRRDFETLGRDLHRVQMKYDYADNPGFIWHQVHAEGDKVPGRSLVSIDGQRNADGHLYIYHGSTSSLTDIAVVEVVYGGKEGVLGANMGQVTLHNHGTLLRVVADALDPDNRLVDDYCSRLLELARSNNITAVAFPIMYIGDDKHDGRAVDATIKALVVGLTRDTRLRLVLVCRNGFELTQLQAVTTSGSMGGADRIHANDGWCMEVVHPIPHDSAAMKHFQTGESSRASGELILYEAARELNRARRAAEREQHEAESARATAKRLRRAERQAEILRFRGGTKPHGCSSAGPPTSRPITPGTWRPADPHRTHASRTHSQASARTRASSDPT